MGISGTGNGCKDTEVWRNNICIENSKKSKVFQAFAFNICPINSKVKQKQRLYHLMDNGLEIGKIGVMAEQQGL